MWLCPITKPVMDSPDRIDYVTVKARSCAPIHVLQAGAATKGQKGQELADIEGHGSSRDSGHQRGRKIRDEFQALPGGHAGGGKMRNSISGSLRGRGIWRPAAVSMRMRIPESPVCRASATRPRTPIAARDALLAAETGVHLHLCHCSTRNSAVLLKLAKLAGVSISGEVCPHHFTLCSDDMVPGDTNYKMNPPLRTREDVEALRQALHDDVFEVISTDHAPHTTEEKSTTHAQGAFRHRRAGDGRRLSPTQNWWRQKSSPLCRWRKR